MKDTSAVINPAFSGISVSSAARISRFSSDMTRLSERSFSASWEVPTSTAYTLSAPFCSIQSVNPPVDAPISRQIQPRGLMPNSSIAVSSFSPPRPTYFVSADSSETAITAVSSNCSEGFVTCFPFTVTLPSFMRADAAVRLFASPFSVINMSSLFIFSFLRLPHGLSTHGQAPLRRAVSPHRRRREENQAR